MNIVDRLLKTDDNQQYCLDAKPEDFYFYDGSNLFLNQDEIDRALEAARITYRNGSPEAVMLLVCKLADGYRAYRKICSEWEGKK